MRKAVSTGSRFALPMFISLAFSAPVIAQDFGSAMLFGIGKSALSEGEELLNEAPDRLAEFLKSAEQGRSFPSARECLGALQVAVNAGTVISNILPFSSVATFEDRRGPVARFRLLLNGDRVHIEAFCDEEKVSATPLSWGGGDPTPEKVTQSSLDAIAGLLLLLQAQGAFENEPIQTSEPRTSSLNDTWSLAASVADFPSFGENDLISDGVKIVNFTASSCAPCSTAYALLEQVNDDLPVYGVFFREAAPNVSEVFGDGPQPFDAMISDVSGKISLKYEVFGLPETLLVGPDGVVLVRHKGPLTATVFSEKFMPMLAGQTVPEPQRTTDIVNDALRQALEGKAAATLAPEGQNGRLITEEVSDALPVAIQQCWNVGSLSSDALRTKVEVAFLLDEDGRPLNETLRMVDYEGGSAESARQTFESARRAIIRCGAGGFELSADQTPNAQEVRLTFDPETMR